MIRELNRSANTLAPVDPDLKRQALEEVLHSTTFARAEQLRNFLRYICEVELAGGGSSISEYSIGVEALGRTKDFIPSDDGVVRNRAHVLRQKLLEYYTQENSAATIRIELPKGSYVPRFLIAEPVPSVEPAPAKRRSRDFLFGLAAAAALFSVVIAATWGSNAANPAIDPIIRDAWGILAAPNANPVVVLGAPTQLLVRPYPPGSAPKNALALPFSPETRAYVEERSPQLVGRELHMRAATSYRAGEVLGVVAILKTLEPVGSSYQVLADIALTPASLRGRNLFLFGDPNLIPTVATYLERGAFSIEYDSKVGDFTIRERTGTAANPDVSYASAQSGDLLDVPGLLTVMPSVDAPDGRKRTVIFACADSAGCQSAAEFFCSPKSLQELKVYFLKEGLKHFPRAYQVIVTGRTDGVSVLSFKYETHRVLDPSTP